ncbi:MAG: hypothetical protein N3D74_03090 [Caldisericia bacterium]|nr:hypothetical protein [Caldisericia bacterium]
MITREIYEILIEEKDSLVLGLSDKPKPSSFSKKIHLYLLFT